MVLNASEYGNLLATVDPECDGKDVEEIEELANDDFERYTDAVTIEGLTEVGLRLLVEYKNIDVDKAYLNLLVRQSEVRARRPRSGAMHRASERASSIDRSIACACASPRPRVPARRRRRRRRNWRTSCSGCERPRASERGVGPLHDADGWRLRIRGRDEVSATRVGCL